MADLRKITITLLGGSTSGKTALFSGINQALVSGSVRLSDDYRIYFKPVSISRGTAKYNEKNEELEVNRQPEIHDSESALEAFNHVSAAGMSAFSMAAAPPNEAGALPAAFQNAGKNNAVSQKNQPAAPVAERNVYAYEGAERMTEQQLLLADLDATYIRAGKGFNAGTQTTRFLEFTFEVYVNKELICLLTISDYAGELLDAATNVPKRMLNILTNQLERSDAAVILANTRLLGTVIEADAGPSDSMFQDEKAKRAVAANAINGHFVALNRNDMTILLALTQTDSPQVDPRISRGGFARAARDLELYVFGNTFDSAKDSNWSYGIIPVSAVGRKKNGEPNVDENNKILDDAVVQQENIDIAILFCLYTAIMTHEDELRAELAEFNGLNGFSCIFNAEKRRRRERILHQLQKFQLFRSAISSKPDLFEQMPCRKFAREIESEVGETKDVKAPFGQGGH